MSNNNLYPKGNSPSSSSSLSTTPTLITTTPAAPASSHPLGINHNSSNISFQSAPTSPINTNTTTGGSGFFNSSSPTSSSNIGRSHSYNHLSSANNNNNNNNLNEQKRTLQHSVTSINPLSTSSGFEININSSVNTNTPSYLTNNQPNIQGLSGDEVTLKRLIRNGNWNNVFKVADMCIANTNNPLSILQYKLCRVISHIKMRSYKIAYDEIQGIGDIRDLVNCYETYPHLFPNRKGTMVPFSMRIIKAELACHLGLEKYQLDALYALLTICKREILNLEQKSKQNQPSSSQQQQQSQQQQDDNKNQNIFLSQLETTSSTLLLTPTASPSIQSVNSQQSSTEPLPLSPITTDEIFEGSSNNNGQTTANDDLNELMIWKLRERRITFSIVTFIIQKNRDFLLAIKILEDLVQRQQADYWILSALGRIHLQMGNISGAEKIFAAADKLIPEPDISVVSNMNKGFYFIATDQYPKSIECFEKIIQLDPSNITAVNNKCISMLYTCDLGGALSTLETLIQTEKERAIDETLIFNICSLYELASEKSNEKKKSIMSEIAKKAPDNFDFKVFKIGTNPVQ
eukprot:gene6077-7571_t